MFDRLKYFFLKHKKFFLLSLAVVLLFIIIWSLTGGKKTETVLKPSEKQAPAGGELAGVPALPTPAKPVELTREDKTEIQLKQFAVNFVERFGSYSNQGNYKNIEDLKPQMTEKMRQRAEELVQKLTQGGPFYGISTKALKSEILDLNETQGEARILVSTQRRESKDSMTNIKVIYQKIEIEMKKIGDDWFVDEARWK